MICDGDATPPKTPLLTKKRLKKAVTATEMKPAISRQRQHWSSSQNEFAARRYATMLGSFSY